MNFRNPYTPLPFTAARVRRCAQAGLACALLLALAGCQDSTVTTKASPGAQLTPPTPSIAGTRYDSNGQIYTISQSAWNDPTGAYRIADVSNTGQHLIAQNAQSNAANPGLWSRFDWTTYQGDLYACHTVGDAANPGDAAATPAAQVANPATGGCAGGAWIHLAGPLNIAGTYLSPFNATLSLSTATWFDSFGNSYQIAEYSNATQYAIAQNGASNSSFRGLWSRFDWTVNQGKLYACLTVGNAASQSAAEATARPDTANPAAGGCTGGVWTLLTPTNGLTLADIWGTHLDPNGNGTSISLTTWSDPSGVYRIQSVSNSALYVVAQNDPANAVSPGLWSRFDWTIYQGDLYACHTVGGAASQSAATTAARASTTNPATGGCAIGAWTHLAGPLAISGTYVDQFSTTQTVTSSTWSDSFADVFHIAEFSNASDYAIAQNDAANAFNANLWSRFDWTMYAGRLYYCQTAYNAASQAAAEATAPANATNPTTGGCGGFSWTRLN